MQVFVIQNIPIIFPLCIDSEDPWGGSSELAQLTPRPLSPAKLVLPNASTPRVEGQRLRGHYYPLSRPPLERQLNASVGEQDALAHLARVTQVRPTGRVGNSTFVPECRSTETQENLCQTCGFSVCHSLCTSTSALHLTSSDDSSPLLYESVQMNMHWRTSHIFITSHKLPVGMIFPSTSKSLSFWHFAILLYLRHKLCPVKPIFAEHCSSGHLLAVVTFIICSSLCSPVGLLVAVL